MLFALLGNTTCHWSFLRCSTLMPDGSLFCFFVWYLWYTISYSFQHLQICSYCFLPHVSHSFFPTCCSQWYPIISQHYQIVMMALIFDLLINLDFMVGFNHSFPQHMFDCWFWSSDGLFHFNSTSKTQNVVWYCNWPYGLFCGENRSLIPRSLWGFIGIDGSWIKLF